MPQNSVPKSPILMNQEAGLKTRPKIQVKTKKVFKKDFVSKTLDKIASIAGKFKTWIKAKGKKTNDDDYSGIKDGLFDVSSDLYEEISNDITPEIKTEASLTGADTQK